MENSTICIQSLLRTHKTISVPKGYYLRGEYTPDFNENLITETDDAEKANRSFSDLTRWYGNVFIASGYQIIRDIEGKIGNKKRSYFFINKIVYE